METDLAKLESDTQFFRDNFKEEGILVIRDFFTPGKIDRLRNSAESVFNRQFKYFGYKGDFRENIKKLFDENFETFVNCGKTIQQGLWELYEISVNPEIKTSLNKLGISSPNLCTRPVMFFNNRYLAKDPVYYKTPPHQDWISMQSSDNSVVVWIPLIDVGPMNGAVIFYPKTHKLGPLPYEKIGGFAKVEVPKNLKNPIQPSLRRGDLVIFSTLLVHESGEIEDDSIRWSCHFRYTDLDSIDFISRGFPNPYEYKPTYK